MIEIGTVLTPSKEGDPIVKVGGIEGQRYMLSDVDFGPVFAMNYDEITAAYDCTGYRVEILPYDEAAEWRKLSRKRFVQVMDTEPQQRRQAAELTPEQRFAADEAKAHAADAEQAFTRKIRRKG